MRKATREDEAERPPAAPGGGPRVRDLVLAALLIAAVVVAVFRPVLHAQALGMDDADSVTGNTLVTNPGWASAERFFTEVRHPSTVRGYYLPVTMTSLMLDWAMGGREQDLATFHRTNLVLHGVSTILVFLLLVRLFGLVVPAAVVALVFGLHPLHVQSLAWIAERKSLLASCFALAALLCYAQRARGGRWPWFVASVGLYLLALLSKPTVVMLPVMLLVLDAWPLRRLSLATVLEKWPYLLLALGSGLVTTLSITSTNSLPPAAGLPVLRMAAQIGYLLAFYAQKVVWPVGLSCLYPPPDFSAPLRMPLLGDLLGVGVAVALVVASLRWTKAVAACALMGLCALAPTFGLLRGSQVIAYDNDLDFPAVAIALLLGYGLARAWAAPGTARAGVRGAALAAGLLVVVLEARAATAALESWRDSVALWRRAVATAPDLAAAHNGLGIALGARSGPEAAIAEYRRALELDSAFFQARLNLGGALLGSGHLDEANRHLEWAQRADSGEARVPYLLGVAALNAGDRDRAAAEFRRAVALRSSFTEALDRLGDLVAAEGHCDESLQLLRRSVALAPGSAHAHFSLAWALQYCHGDGRELIAELEQAIRIAPVWVEPVRQLAWLKVLGPATVRDAAGALPLAERAVALTDHRDASALDALAAAFAANGRFPQAVGRAHEALDLASQTGLDSLAAAIRTRLALYERGIPYTGR